MSVRKSLNEVKSGRFILKMACNILKMACDWAFKGMLLSLNSVFRGFIQSLLILTDLYNLYKSFIDRY